MLVAAAICPHPPLLVPAVGGAVANAVRTAAVAAVGDLLASRPDRLVVVGDAPGTGAAVALVRADFRPFGVDYVLGDGIRLPLSLAVGRWLLAEAGWRAPGDCPPAPRRGVLVSQGDSASAMSALPARWQGVARDLDANDAARLGAVCAGLGPRVAMLVMGDGTARRTAKAPGAFDPDAEPLDDEIAAALGNADAAALAALDQRRCAAQLVAGRASWQVLAGAARHSGGSWLGQLLAHEAPFGVGYLVAGWRRA